MGNLGRWLPCAMETAEEDVPVRGPGTRVASSPREAVLVLRPVPVTVRSVPGHALAYTVTHVLVERDSDGGYDLRWEAGWQVKRSARAS